VGSAFSLEDKGSLLNGFLLGCNAGTMPEQCSNLVQTGFKLGSKCREEAEGHSLRMAKGGKASVESRRKSLGTTQPSNNARTMLEQRPNQSSIPNLLSTKEKDVPAPRKRVTKHKEPIPVESLSSILQGKEDSYWKLAGLFGPTKNPSPKVTARLYVTAILEFAPDQIHEKALELVKATSEQKYLPQLAKWLEGEGYRNPAQTPQINGGTNGSRSPKHRAGIDAAYIEHLSDRPTAPVGQEGNGDADVLSLWEQAASNG